MTDRRPDKVAWMVATFCATLVVLAFAVPALHAQEAADSATDGSAPAAPSPLVDTWTPFSPSPVDPGAIRYEELLTGPRPSVTAPDGDAPIDEETYRALTMETRQSVDDIQAFAEQNGHAVHQAWSRYTDAMVEQAELSRAEYEAGLSGFGDVGVLP